MQVDKDENELMRPDSQPSLTALHKSLSLLFSAGEQSETKLRMNRSRSKKKTTMQVVTTLKKTKTGRSPLVTGATAGTQEIKEEDIVNNSEPASLSTLTEDRRTQLSELVTEMVTLC